MKTREAARILLHLWIWDLRAQWLGSRAGLLWNLLAPGAVLVVYLLVFRHAPGIRFSVGGPEYGAAMVAGLVPWLFVQEALTRGATALVDQRHVLTQVPVPPLLFPLATTLTAWTRHLGALVLLGALLFVDGVDVGWSWLAVIGPMIPLALGLAGTSAWLAFATVHQRDVAPATSAALLPAFFATPVLYPMHALPPELRWVVELNPFTPIVLAYRDLCVGAGRLDPAGLAYSSIVGMTLFVTGLWLLRRAEGRVAEQL